MNHILAGELQIPAVLQLMGRVLIVELAPERSANRRLARVRERMAADKAPAVVASQYDHADQS